MRIIEITAGEFDEGAEVGELLRRHGFSRGIITKLKQGSGLLVNGEKVRTVDIVHKGDVIKASMSDDTEIVPNSGLKAEIIYDDDDIVIFDKPPFMPVHPSIRHYDDTLANLFTALYPGTAFRSVSRLDRNTSGLVLVAKNRLAAAKLTAKKENRPKKLYYAVVAGDVTDRFGCCGEIIKPIARVSESIITRTISDDGQYAHTVFKVIKSSRDMSFLEISLVTGRTHQIRVHFSSEGFPLMGDDLYGGSTELINRQALHCGYISFRHPITGESMKFRSEPPTDMQGLIEKI